MPSTLRWGVVICVCVTLCTVLHKEVWAVPGHTHNSIRLMQEDMGQHPPMAVHHNDLTIRSSKQYLQI